MFIVGWEEGRGLRSCFVANFVTGHGEVGCHLRILKGKGTLEQHKRVSLLVQEGSESERFGIRKGRYQIGQYLRGSDKFKI